VTSYRVGPGSSLKVWTYKNASTVLARFAHDLCFEVRSFVVTLSGEDDALEVSVRVDPLELELLSSVQADGSLKPVKPRDKVEIERTARGTVLEATRYREVVFEGSGPWHALPGTLELHGSRQPLTVHSTREGERCSGSVEFAPSRWGIAPYRAFLGALKLDDRVRVSWELNLTPA